MKENNYGSDYRKDKRRKTIMSKNCKNNQFDNDKIENKIKKQYKQKKREIDEDSDWENWQDYYR